MICQQSPTCCCSRRNRMSFHFQGKLRLLSHSEYVYAFDSILMYEKKCSFQGLLSYPLELADLIYSIKLKEYAKWKVPQWTLAAAFCIVSMHNFHLFLKNVIFQKTSPYIPWTSSLLFRNFIKRQLLAITWLSQRILENL